MRADLKHNIQTEYLEYNGSNKNNMLVNILYFEEKGDYTGKVINNNVEPN